MLGLFNTGFAALRLAQADLIYKLDAGLAFKDNYEGDFFFLSFHFRIEQKGALKILCIELSLHVLR